MRHMSTQAHTCFLLKAATGGAGQFGGAPGAFYGGQGQGQSAGYPSGYAAAGYGGQD